jgi:hypothetical protein
MSQTCRQKQKFVGSPFLTERTLLGCALRQRETTPRSRSLHDRQVSRSYLGDEIADDFRCLTATISESKPCDRRLPSNCIAGIAIMRTVAYYISWSKRQDKLCPSPPRRRPQSGVEGLGGRPVSTAAPTFGLDPEQPAARGDVAPLGRPAYLRGRLRIIGLASFGPLSL